MANRLEEWGPWGYILDSGMTTKHFRLFQECARHLDFVIAVRNTNVNSTVWIERKYPPKPKELEALHTHPETGRLTARTEDEVQFALDPKSHGAKGSKKFLVVDKDGVARDLAGHKWSVNLWAGEQLKYGEVVDPETRRVIVGDYDLLTVFPVDAPGRNLCLASSDGETLANFMDPFVGKVKEWINAKLISEGDLPRIMHGADDQYVTKKTKEFKEGGATAFYPQGFCVRLLRERSDVERFYEEFRRVPIWGRHVPRQLADTDGPCAKVISLAARRGLD